MYDPTIPVMPIALAAAVVRDGSPSPSPAPPTVRGREHRLLDRAPRGIQVDRATRLRKDHFDPTGHHPEVASLGGRFTERRMDASHACAAFPPMPTLVVPPLGRSRSCAIRQRASRNRVGPTVSVTGAETAVRAAAAASASRAAVTFARLARRAGAPRRAGRSTRARRRAPRTPGSGRDAPRDAHRS